MIYCVEDDAAVRDLMIYTLRASGFEAAGFTDGKAFFSALEETLPELVMLDIMLPGDDGLTILAKLRANPVFAEIPVIMATAKSTEYDTVIGLDSGADDYLAKPFGMMEMVSRIKAVLRRTESRNRNAVLTVGEICMNTSGHSVSVKGEKITLTLKEYELLELFMENTGKVFSREQLLAKVWNSDFIGETRTVDVHIGTLRTKLGGCSGYIETVRGVGYRMVCDTGEKHG